MPTRTQPSPPSERPAQSIEGKEPAMEPDGDWILVSEDALSLDAAMKWVARPSCGAVVSFSGCVRDHSQGRPGVVRLEYEAYEPYATDRMAGLARAARRRYPAVERVVLHHRVGSLTVGDVAVIVVVAAGHRPEAFGAARFCIDAVKREVPIWKREIWAGGASWDTCAHDPIVPTS
jgi:molybdopterin synthase catalytic subunit